MSVRKFKLWYSDPVTHNGLKPQTTADGPDALDNVVRLACTRLVRHMATLQTQMDLAAQSKGWPTGPRSGTAQVHESQHRSAGDLGAAFLLWCCSLN
jgi:hypothetical protein